MRGKAVKVAQYKYGKLIKEYDNIEIAARSVGGQSSHISECMRNVPHRNTHKGYEWRNVNDK